MTYHNSRYFASALAAVLLVPCWGCGPTSGELASLVAVKGKVTYKGQPVAKGIVRFEPEGYGRPATGRLQSDGTFVLGTYKEGDGVVAGSHKVTVGGFDKPLASNRALKKYGARSQSGLTAEVDSEHTDFTFELR
jgi:hypothetical protein